MRKILIGLGLAFGLAFGACAQTPSTPFGTITGLTPSCGLTGGGTIGALAVSQSILVNRQLGTTYTFLSTDCGKLVTFNNLASVAATLPTAGTTGFQAGFAMLISNYGPGTVTITPQSGLIGLGGSLTIVPNVATSLISDGANWQAGGNASTLIGAPLTLNSGTNFGITAPGAMAPGGTYTVGATTDKLDFQALGLGGLPNTRALRIYGSTSGSLDIDSAAIAGAGSKLTLPGATSDLSLTGGAGQVLMQQTLGGGFTTSVLSAASLSNGTTGSGAVVLANTPTLVTPVLSAPSLTGTVTGANNLPFALLAQMTANSLMGNSTNALANNTAVAVPACVDSGGNHLNWTSGTGFSCGTSGGSTIAVITRVFTATGTYTPTGGMKYVLAFVTGSGAGGGNAGSGAGSGGGGGGGAGATKLGAFSAATIGTSQAVTIGAAGAATAGGNTSSLGALLSAGGGQAGAANSTTSGGFGGTGGTATTTANALGFSGGDGSTGGMGNTTDGINGSSGTGGASFWGGGGRGGIGGATGTGSAGVAYGSGGGGGSGGNSAAGAVGVILIVEF